MNSSAQRQKRFLGTKWEGVALVLFTASTWGLAWPTQKYLLTMLPPFTVRATAGTIGCACALLAALLRREKICPPRDQWPRILMFALLNFGLFLVLTTSAIAHLRASEAVTITYTMPVWTVLLSWLLLGERPQAIKLLALVLALGGVVLLVGADPAQAALDKVVPALMALGAAISFGLGTVLTQRLPLRLPPAVSVFWQAFFGIGVVMAFAIPEQRSWDHVTTIGWEALFYVAVVPLAVAYLAWFRALRLVSASTASIATLISPVVGVTGSGLLLGETFGPRQAIAMALTLTGVALAARR
jgi:drug/metabolite transporter (DMT)-like permease